MERFDALAGRMFAAWCVAFVMALAPPGWSEGVPFTGDVNADGAIDVLDVQVSANMALGAQSANGQADVDLNAAVDILDVQNITNTVLGVGGLVQRVSGQLALPGKQAGPWRVVAVSEDGRTLETLADDAGNFSLPLPVRNSWSLAILNGAAGAETNAGNIIFPVEGAHSVTLPLPNLSRGEVLDLGVLPIASAGVAQDDVRDLLAETADLMVFTDDNGNGVSDMLEEWLLPLPISDGAIPGLSIDDEEVLQFLASLESCAGVESYRPNLADFENGLPVQLKPLLTCLPGILESWIRSEVTIQPWMEPLLAQLVNYLDSEIEDGLEDWFDDSGIPELTDTNRNAVPDFIEPNLCIVGPELAGVQGDCALDSDGDGVPDYLEDSNNNGTPNVADPVALEGDADGDGIPDGDDVDDNNDGTPDYAD